MTNIIVNQIKKISYSGLTKLRSGQHLHGFERQAAEAYRSELTHDIWGDADKFKEWAKNKIEQLINKDYSSNRLSRDITEHSRNELVKAWGEELKNNVRTSKNPFLQLKIMSFITKDLRNDNQTLAPVFRKNLFEDALSIVTRTGQSFKKVYISLLKNTKCNNVDYIEENVVTEKVRGTWYHVKTLTDSEAVKSHKKAKATEEFIMCLSQGSDWCIRNKHNLEREYVGTQFHIFLDDKGAPQLCLASLDDKNKVYQAIKGNRQYEEIPAKYREILSKFVKERNLEDAVLKHNDGSIQSILDFCKI